METTLTALSSECPFLQPARSPGSLGRLVGMYCRLPRGAVRVPPPDEIRRFCQTGKFERCPAYRRYAPAH
jgi:hypothetical protein